MRLLTPLALAILAFNTQILNTQIYAQESVADEKISQRFQNKDSDFEGWDRSWRLDAEGIIVNNRSVVGKTDGSSITVGGKEYFFVGYFDRHHEWTNDFVYELQYTRQPSIDEFQKNLDLLSVDSLYLYRFDNPHWVGPFARARLETPIFRGYDIRASDTNFLVNRQDGSSTAVTTEKLRLTDYFSPLKLRQSLGAFLWPVEKKDISLQFLVGVGARESFTGGQFAISDSDTTPEIDVQELRNIYQLGTEASARIKGKLRDDEFEYSAGAATLNPWINNKSDSDDRSAFKLSTYEFDLNLAYHFASWIRIEYVFTAIKDPQIINPFQITHDAKLIIGLDILKSRRDDKS